MQNLFGYFSVMGGIATVVFLALTIISSIRKSNMRKWWVQNLIIALCLCALGTTTVALIQPSVTYGQVLVNMINRTNQSSQ